MVVVVAHAAGIVGISHARIVGIPAALVVVAAHAAAIVGMSYAQIVNMPPALVAIPTALIAIPAAMVVAAHAGAMVVALPVATLPVARLGVAFAVIAMAVPALFVAPILEVMAPLIVVAPEPPRCRVAYAIEPTAIVVVVTQESIAFVAWPRKLLLLEAADSKPPPVLPIARMTAAPVFVPSRHCVSPE
ncbi:MAG TPA: hypothetical protein VIV11_39355 [Kofleriaceae bacterium]